MASTQSGSLPSNHITTVYLSLSFGANPFFWALITTSDERNSSSQSLSFPALCWKCSFITSSRVTRCRIIFLCHPPQACEPRVCVDWSGAVSISARRNNLDTGLEAESLAAWGPERRSMRLGHGGARGVGVTEDNHGDLAEEFAWATGHLSRAAPSEYCWWCPRFSSQPPAC